MFSTVVSSFGYRTGHFTKVGAGANRMTDTGVTTTAGGTNCVSSQEIIETEIRNERTAKSRGNGLQISRELWTSSMVVHAAHLTGKKHATLDCDSSALFVRRALCRYHATAEISVGPTFLICIYKRQRQHPAWDNQFQRICCIRTNPLP